jgi:hypothetical protein
MHIGQVFYEKLAHVFLNFIGTIKLITSWSFQHERTDLEPVKGRAYVVESLIHFVVVIVQSLELGIVPHLKLIQVYFS